MYIDNDDDEHLDPEKWGMYHANPGAEKAIEGHPKMRPTGKRQNNARIDLSEPLTPTQDYFYPSRVKAFSEGVLDYSSADHPIHIVRHKNQNYIWNGHHRILSKIQQVEPHADVLLTNLDRERDK